VSSGLLTLAGHARDAGVSRLFGPRPIGNNEVRLDLVSRRDYIHHRKRHNSGH
jgi:hypothetical protein